jgi:hypothetical protein
LGFGFGCLFCKSPITLFSTLILVLLPELDDGLLAPDDGRLRAIGAERSLALFLLFAVGLLRAAGRFFLRPLASENSSPSKASWSCR